MSICLEETITEKDTRTSMSITAVFTVVRPCKQARCPLAYEWIKKVWYIYTMDYHWAIKDGGSSTETHTFPRGNQTVHETATWHGELDLGLCAGREWWDGEGRGRAKRKDTYVYLSLIHVDGWQRPTQFCKAAILQLKIN